MTEIKAKKSGLEFDVPEGWKLESLGSLSEIQQGLSKGKKYKNTTTVFHPYLRVANVKDGYFDLSEIKEIEIPASELERYSILENDILITEGGDPDKLGRGSIWMGEVQRPVFQNHLFRIRSTKSKLEPWFLFNYLQSHKAKTYFLNSAKQTTGIASINSSQVKETPILLPPLPEQRAIAQVLGKMDEAIQTTERLIAQKELRKKWLMQHLLTGKMRLKGFSGEWKEYTFDELLKVVKRPVEWDDNELYKLISVRRRSGGIFFREALFGHQIKVKDLRDAKVGDFLFSKMQIVHGASALVTKEFEGSKISGSYIATVTKDYNLLNIEFFDWYSKLPFFYHQTLISSYGVHIEKMTFDFETFLQLEMKLPSIEEQTAIARVLQTADQEISLLKAKADKLREQKKGMMQVLLIGKVRLKNLEN